MKDEDRTKFRIAIEGIADAGTEVDTGSGMGSTDFWVKVNGREYFVAVQPSLSQIEKDTKSRAPL